MVKYRTCYDNGKYNKCIYGRKANTYELGNLFYGPVILGVEVRKQLGHRFIYRVQPGNGYANSIVGKRYQQKYDYFVPDSINNTAGELARVCLRNAVSAWQALSEEEKETWRAKENYIQKIPGYNLFIRQYFKDNYAMAYQTLIYDVVIDAAGGGDYTSIATALTTEGSNKSFFVRRGTYAETTDIIPEDSQIIFFDRVIINFSAGKHYNMITSGQYSTLAGYCEITGDGKDCRLFDSRQNLINAENLILKITPSANLQIVADTRIIFVSGVSCIFNFHASTITLTSPDSAYVASFLSTDCYKSKLLLSLNTFTLTGGTAAIGFDGLATFGDYNIFTVLINSVTTATGNTGRGLMLNVGSDNNTVLGVSMGCDNSNAQDGGSNNNINALAH